MQQKAGTLVPCVYAGLRRERPLYRPTVSQALSYGTGSYSENFRPLWYRCGFSAPSNRTVGGSVSALYFAQRPPTILWRVWAVVVNSIKRVPTGRALTHVFQKLHKRFLPLATRIDTTSTVSVVGVPVFVIAPTFHALPGSILGSFLHAVRLACASHAGSSFPRKTPAAFYCPRFDVSENNAFPRAAIAETRCAPRRAPRFMRVGVDQKYCEPTEFHLANIRQHADLGNPVRWSSRDTRGTKEQVDILNRQWKRLCQKKP